MIAVMLAVGAIMIFRVTAEPVVPIPIRTHATPVSIEFLVTPTPLSFEPIPEPTKPYYVTGYVYGYLSTCGVYKPALPGPEGISKEVTMAGAQHYVAAICPPNAQKGP